MSGRLSHGGRLIDRTRPLAFRFNDRPMRGFGGDTLASALLANDQLLMGRSFKYHRPRGVVGAGPEEPNALMNLGEGPTLEPNQRATVTELFDGLTATTQNHWPSLEFDLGAVNSLLSQFLPAGFYYKMFMHPRPFWKHIYEPFIRQSAGLGRPPAARDADEYEHFYAHTDVLVVGGGVAGLQAARSASEAGAEVLLIDQGVEWGGRAHLDAGPIDGASASDWVSGAVRDLEGLANVRLRLRTTGAGIYDHGYALALEQVSDHVPGSDGPRHRLWKIRAKQIILATGAIERPLVFPGNDIPGVMLASAVRDYVGHWAVNPGDRTVVVTNNDDAYRTAIALKDAGLDVPAIIDARSMVTGALPELARQKGIDVHAGRAVASVKGVARVEGVAIAAMAGEGHTTEVVPCDAVAMSGGWSPAVHLWSHTGGKLLWNDAHALFQPDPDRAPSGADGQPFVAVAGVAAGPHGPEGDLGTAAALESATDTSRSVLARLGKRPKRRHVPKAESVREAPMKPVWIMPEGAGDASRAKAFLDFQNDVKVSDVDLAAREGFESVEHAKRYTTLGMATDQGKLSNVNGLAILADARGVPVPEVGTTTFRPPYTPISMGAIGGEARGALFQPVRRTPIHDWHEANGAAWEPVGHWRRPYCYRRPGEAIEDSVAREITATRTSVGLLDASTLGKILVKGPDAGRFLDMMYTNMMSSLGEGRCRYGLMCSENGFLIDDGVVARIGPDTWLCHTTSGGADRIHAHFEDWLQCEWWDWKVHTLNVTEAYAQVAVVGPKAREVLDRLGGMDLSAEALPFMRWADGTLDGIPARVFRISFSGELSYEIAVAAGQGRALWDALLEAGAGAGITPYGTEALHVMRAEKGFIMIGDETDGTVIPQDLGLDWAISKKKDDFLGKRAQQRPHMTDPDRWRLVGLETLDGSVLPEGAYAVDEGQNANGQRNMQGRVTSTYHSPTLGRGIAMGLVRHGPARMGEVLSFARTDGSLVKARIVTPVFYDPEGEKQNV